MDTDNYHDIIYVIYVLRDVVNQMESHKHDFKYTIDLIDLNNNESDYVKDNIKQLNYEITRYNNIQERHTRVFMNEMNEYVFFYNLEFS